MAMLRQVRFPLKLKLLSLMIILIASSLIVFVGIALQIFREDKGAYIYESLLNKASSEQIILAQKLGDGSFEVKSGQLVFNGTDVTSVLEKELNQNSVYGLKIIVPMQTELFQWQDGKLSPVFSAEQKFLEPMLSKSVNEAVKELEIGKEKVLHAYNYNPEKNFAFMVTLPQKKAYEATSYLIKKSVIYGFFILGVSMLLSVFLARPLTAQLETLFGVTQEIAKGNFDQKVILKGHDEVGALSDSINDMSGKIIVFMNEMKEKARLENEVAVAQLVQTSFFPTTDSLDSKGVIYGHFEPATECGGDWWGYLDHKDWRIFFIADATGHGVPAALLTATLNCCKTSLSYIMESKPELVSSPDEILRYMNQAVYGAGGSIQVTCFVATFNQKTKELKYSNASHTPPLLFLGSPDKELTKDSFRPLIEANGPRLGQSAEAIFMSETLRLGLHDTIFFYTDGLTEAENLEGSRFGERRLIKALSEFGQGSPKEIIDGVLTQLGSFKSGRPNGDDITAVAMKVL
jgi:sigma-B regulation protein RsbU (phosphoserine phosphatase)